MFCTYQCVAGCGCPSGMYRSSKNSYTCYYPENCPATGKNVFLAIKEINKMVLISNIPFISVNFLFLIDGSGDESIDAESSNEQEEGNYTFLN